MGQIRPLLLVFPFCFLLLLRSPVEASMLYNTGGGPVPHKLNVHLVPHTHDDLGWLQTADQYYVGPDNSRADNLQGASAVQYILHTIVQELEEDPNRKFSYVEMGFFARWWRQQSPAKQARVKQLVASGQLEFVNGGWCMHDEAATHYVDMIDQTTLGHRHLQKYFGFVPRNGWQIDPFGHSAVQAYLLTAEAGFDGMFVARIDYQDKLVRLRQRNLEMIWRGSATLGATSQIFMDVFQNHYNPPYGFKFETNVDYSPVQDDLHLDGYNVHQRVNDLVEAAQQQSAATRTNHIMWTMGDDFSYQTANSWYSAMDRLIHYANLDGRVNVLYSTPTIYLESQNAANESWPLKTGDFFPYADGQESYWTGYFTSRPALKGYVRTLSGYLQAARQLEFLRGRQNNIPGGFSTDSLEEAMATAQHHDGVSGTERQAVADDYARGLYIGAEESKQVINAALEFFTGASTGTFQQCGLLNVSFCPASEAATHRKGTAKSLFVVAYNPLAWARVEYIRIPVSSENLYVTDSTGNVVESQILSISSVTRNLRDFYVEANYGKKPSDRPLFDLVFQASVPPLGFTLYAIDPSSSSLEPASGAAVKSTVEYSGHTYSSAEAVQIGNGALTLTFSNDTGHLASIYTNQTRITHTVTQTNLFYRSNDGDQNPDIYQSSGAYIFQPDSNTKYKVNSSATVHNTIVRGPLVEEIRQVFSPWVFQVMRVYKGQQHVEVEFTIGPIPTDDGNGKEVITSISTSIESSQVSYTDSNGRDFIKRIRDYRDSWDLEVVQPISGNYYPINLGMYITDNETDFSVLVDRAVGGASIADGQVELMLHRRLVVDDDRGVGQPLNEMVCTGNCIVDCNNNNCNCIGNCEGLTIRGRYFMSIIPRTDAALWRRTQGQAILTPPVLAFTTVPGKQSWEFSAMAPNTSLPANVALLTLQELETGQVLLRLAHLYQENEHPQLSQLATVDLKSLFYGRQIINATEASLTANQAKSAMRKPLQWKVEGDGAGQVNPPIRGAPFDASSLQVELGPMEIRTFIVSPSQK